MKKVVFILAFLFSLYSKSQLTYQWAYQAGGTVFEYGQAIAVDPSGNVYVTGTFSGTVDFDPSASSANLTGFSGSADIFLAKYTSAGAFVWVKQIGGTNTEKAYDVACDATGAWLAGNFMGTCDFDPSAAVSNTTSLGGGSDGDGFFAKYDVSGNYQWGVRIGSTANDRVMGIAVDGSQNCYITGFIGYNTDFDPSAASFSLNVTGTYNAYFAKYTSTGTLTYAKQIVGGYSDSYDITLGPLNAIYITGSFSGTSDMDPGIPVVNLTTASIGDVYFARYDNAGNYQLAKQLAGPNIDIGFAITTDASGNIFVGGEFSSGCDFDPAVTTSLITNAGGGDLFVAKYSSLGALTWAIGTGGAGNDYCYGVGVDAGGIVYTTGRFQGVNIDFDPSASSSVLTATAMTPFFAGYTASGGFLFANQLGNIGGEGRHLIVNNASVYVTGFFDQTGDFDLNAPIANLTSLGSSDVFFAKYNACAGSPPAQPSAISGNTLVCYGTPQTYSVVNDATATGYTWNFPGGWGGVSTTNTISASGGNSGMISVTANNNCGSSIPSTLSVTVGGFSSASISATNIPCNAFCNGSASVNLVGGAAPFTYSWTTSATTPSVTNLCAGPYTVTVMDSYGCSIQKTVTINQPPALILTVVGFSNAHCSQADGSATVVASGGTPGYTYSWSAGPTYTNAIASNLTAGIKTISINDANNCGPVTATISIANIPGPTISSVAFTNVKCFNVNNGSATVNASASTAPLTYSWSSAQTTSVISSLSPGNYTITVKDGANCTSFSVITITQPTSAVSVSVSQTSFTMCASNPTSLNSAASGGVGSYTYTWNPGNLNGATVTVIPPSNTIYTVTAADGNSCTSIATVSVYTSISPTVTTVASLSAICAGQSATITASGASTYTWNTTSNSSSIVVTPTASTNYTVNGTGTLVCTGFSSITVNVNPNPTVTAASNMSLICVGQAATITANGANTYTWNTTSNSTVIVVTPTTSTTYTVTGTDASGCTNTFTLTQNVSTCSGMNEFISNDTFLTIYPNPAKDMISIRSADNVIGLNYRVLDVLGRTLLSGKFEDIEINVSKLGSGIYFLKIEEAGSSYKFIKE